MAKPPTDPLQRSRRPAIAIIILGPLLVCAALVHAFGSVFQPRHADFAGGEQLGIVEFDNGVTAFGLESDDGAANGR